MIWPSNNLLAKLPTPYFICLHTYTQSFCNALGTIQQLQRPQGLRFMPLVLPLRRESYQTKTMQIFIHYTLSWKNTSTITDLQTPEQSNKQHLSFIARVSEQKTRDKYAHNTPISESQYKNTVQKFSTRTFIYLLAGEKRFVVLWRFFLVVSLV